jgi:anti-sigma regulatory factor (Ser/Thr protein kinase)
MRIKLEKQEEVMGEKRKGGIADGIVLPGRAESIPTLVEFVAAHAWESGFEAEKIEAIREATEEAFDNIVRHAFSPPQEGEITITCVNHDSGALIVNITDTGAPFNMLVATSFPETADFAGPGQALQVKKMKRAIRNIEYRRDAKRNILIFTISR